MIWRVSSVAALTAVVVVGVAPAAFAVNDALEIVSVSSVRGTHSLQARKTNVVVVTTDLAFKVAIRNPTTQQRRHVTVTLFIRQGQMTNIWKRVTIDRFLPRESKSVTFGNLGHVAFARRENLKVTVRTDSKTYVSIYPVIFALG
jgi:hypothetical protein